MDQGVVLAWDRMIVYIYTRMSHLTSSVRFGAHQFTVVSRFILFKQTAAGFNCISLPGAFPELYLYQLHR